MKKLLFVYDNMMIGGTTTALLSLLNELDYTEYQVDLLLFHHHGPLQTMIPPQVNLLPAAEKPSFIKGLSASKRKIVRTLLNGKALLGLRCYLKYKNTPKGNFRLIMMHCGTPSQVAISVKLDKHYDAAIGFMECWADHYVLSGKVQADRRLAWFHLDYANTYLLKEMDESVLQRADSIVLVSDNCRDHFNEVFPEYTHKSVCLENITSPEYVRARAAEGTPVIPKAKVNFCSVCRCDLNHKGLDRIVRAMARLREEGRLDGAMWHLVGGGAELPMLEQMVAEAELEPYVTLHGSQNNPLTYLKQMDFFMLGSRYEGKPVAVEEAICLGLPCLVTAYASAAEQITEGVNGWIVDNSDEGVYQGLKWVLDNRSYERVTVSDPSSEKNRQVMERFYEMLK